MAYKVAGLQKNPEALFPEVIEKLLQREKTC